MKSFLVLAVTLLANLATVQCIDFGKIFSWFKNPFGGRTGIGATARDCKEFSNRNKCKFDTASLKFDVDNAIELVVNTGGRKIKCNKLLNKGKSRWYGSCDGDAEDANFITRVDKDGKESVHGTIQVGDDICRISPNILGEQEIQCIPRDSFKSEDDPKDIATSGNPERVRQLTSDTTFGFVPAFDQSLSQSPLRGNNQHDNSRQLFDNSGANIDIMVAWTKAAECGNAGLVSGCTVTTVTENLMRGLIDLAIAETNTAYELSGILTVLRLVHAYRENDYVEKGDFVLYLEDITYTNDGFMDGVHAKRTLYGADAVHLIVGDPNSCGIAWSGSPSSAYLFSVSQYDCATGYFSFGHEIGHNLGMYHDRGTENACSEANTFNYGYRDTNAAFRTILSYNCKMSQCDAMPKDGCTRIQRFSSSNPAFTYNGKPIGDTKRDNAKQANNVRASVAAYFPAMNCQSNVECNDNNPITLDTCNIATRVCVFTPVISVPVKPPTKTPTRAPVQTKQPTKAPVQTNKPTAAPSMKPIQIQSPAAVPVGTIAPALPPTNAPNSPPTKIPTRPPTKTPTRPPTKTPTRQPTKTPTRKPTKTPTRKPTRAPTRVPLRPPTKAPVLPQSFFMESLKITGVTSSTWKLITLSKMYVSPVPVCTVMYDQGTSLRPAVVRMQNVGATSFEIRLQNPSELALTGRDVHCVVVEEGAWKLPDGRLIESQKYSSTVTDRKGSYNGQSQVYRNKYTKPVVLGQVMSYNDAMWSVFWSRSSSGQNSAPTSTSIITGKHVGEDSRTTRLAETVGFIVIESGHLKSNNIEIETGRGPDSIIGYTEKKGIFKFNLKFNSRFGTTPVVAVLSQAAMDDSDGSWAVLTSNPSTTSVGVSVDEDQLADTERKHNTEEVNYAVFSSVGAIQLTKI